ncbi:hypothetical protein HRI_003088000 [Hibiscus trionum]|uniref:Thionin-like protein 2 n=1 Tax=Hibiscus trionum TaxID=183268 RepID=A0A9W7M8I5_HIBTR|nr:hypothetical protein HRI_003088000 [Hibiscus trionum]
MASKKLMAVSLMVLMMKALLVGQVQGVDELNIGVKEGIGTCVKICAPRCFPLFKPIKIALCMASCMIKCKVQPTPIVFDCTTACANSVINAYNSTDVGRINNIVGSCYKTCKVNN